MKNISFILILNLCSLVSISQNMESIDIAKGSWVTLGSISSFFSNDTIVLKRIPNYLPESSEYNPGYLYSFDIHTTDLYFENNGKLIFNYYRVGYVPEANYKWRVNTKSQTINIDIIGKSKNKYRIIDSNLKTEKCTAYVGNERVKTFYDAEVQTIVLKKI